MDLERNVIVEVRERNAVLGADRLPDDDLVDVIELIPVFVSVKYHIHVCKTLSERTAFLTVSE